MMDKIALLKNIFTAKKKINLEEGEKVYQLKISNTVENLNDIEIAETIERLYELNVRIENCNSCSTCFKVEEEDIMLSFNKYHSNELLIIEIKILTYKGYEPKKGLIFENFSI